jgi:D-alanyl-D-alanine carboxypeptidase
MSRLPALACLLIVLAGPACGDGREPRPTPPGLRLTAAVARELDARLRERVAEAGIPGAAAAIVFRDGRMWRGAAGDAVVAPRQPMTPETSIPFDSITKLAAAALAMRLVEEGRLGLDDPITRWYPDWRGDPRATIRDLLGHTAGTRDPQIGGRQSTHLSQRRLLGVAPKPGPRTTRANYSSVGYVIVGRILERAAGEPLAVAMRRLVFDHPGGDGLAFQPAEQPHPPLAHSYWYPSGGGRPVDASDGGPILPDRSRAATFGAAGALAGDVPSLARWAHELLAGRVVSPASLREMARFHPSGTWEGYGLGLAQDSFDGHTMWGHTGDGLGSHTELWHLPREGLTLAVSWNDDRLDRAGGLHLTLLRAALTP